MGIYRFLCVICIIAIIFSPGIALADEALDVIYSRKSVRNYTDEPVSKDDLIQLVKAGMAAPSAMDRRPWVFIIITEKQTLNKLADALSYADMLRKAGAAIIVCGNQDKTLPGVEQGFWIQDCSAASENILLAAESLKLGAVWLGVYPNGQRIANVVNILNIPDQIIPLNVISICHPVGLEKPKDKFDQANIHWEKW